MRSTIRDGLYRQSRRTNIDWALHSPTSNIGRHPQRSGFWQCGDRRKLRQTVSNFTKYSSLHGLHYVCSNDSRISWVMRIFYKLLFAGLVASMIVSLVLLLQESLSTESVYITTTSKDGDIGPQEDPHFPKFPQITLCRKPPYRMDVNDSELELLQFAYINLGYPFSSLSPQETALLIGSTLHQLKKETLTPKMKTFVNKLLHQRRRFKKYTSSIADFNLTQYIVENSVTCENMFARCIAFVFEIPCCKLFHPILTPAGKCYTMKFTEDLEKMYRQSSGMLFYLLFDLHAAPLVKKAVDIGYEVHLSDPRDKTATFTKIGNFLVNGHQTTVKAKLVKTSRIALYTPWHGRSNNCPRLEPYLDPMGYGDRYFRSVCVISYMHKNSREKCGCKSIADNMPQSSNVSLKECEGKDFRCILKFALLDNLTSLSQACTPPCIEYHYNIDANLMKIGDDNISRLYFLYDHNQYSLEEYKITTLSSLLSQIGGAMGLYLGASVITVWEVISFLVTCFCSWLLPHKRVSSTSESLMKNTCEKLSVD